MPVTLVVRVIVGVVVAFATVPPRPFADATLVVVTVPPAEGATYFTPSDCVESATIMYQSVHTGRRVFPVADRTNISPFVVRGFTCDTL